MARLVGNLVGNAMAYGDPGRRCRSDLGLRGDVADSPFTSG